MKTNLLNAFKQTLSHVGELALIIFVAWLILTLFHVTDDQYMILLGLVLAAFTKFARASDSIGIPDYVNGPTPSVKEFETEKAKEAPKA